MSGDHSEGGAVAPWELGVSGRGIIPIAQVEENLDELQDMVDELLQSDIQEGVGDGGRASIYGLTCSVRHTEQPVKAVFTPRRFLLSFCEEFHDVIVSCTRQLE